MENKKSTTFIMVILSIAMVVIGLLIGYIIFGLNNNTQENNKIEQSDSEEKVEDTNTQLENKVNINKRLYSVESNNKQRYYLLLDDATYGTNQNFLNKKTYVLDLNMVNGNEIVKEIDLASVFSPIVNQYINNHKGNNSGICSVEYFSANTGLTPPPIDYEKEFAFIGYYRCVNNNVETSLGSEIYAYNVETNTIRSLGSSN